MTNILDIVTLQSRVGQEELLQIAGTGDWNSAEGRVLDMDALTGAMAYVDALVSGYVLARNPWVADTTSEDMPEILRGIAVDLLRYRLRDRSGAGTGIGDTVKARYDDALRQLRDIAAGKLDLRQIPGGQATPGAADSVRITGGAPVTPAMTDEYLG